MWEGTLTDVGLAITTTRSSPWLVLPTLGDEPINREGLAPMSSSGTHMVAPEAYKPYVGGNSNRCGTCDYNYKV